MAQVVKLKRSSVEGKVPTTSNLELGELSINTHDGRIFFEKNNGSDSIEHIITTNSQTTGSIEIVGNITASGNISSSGTIHTSNIESDSNLIITSSNLTLGTNQNITIVPKGNTTPITINHPMSSINNNRGVIKYKNDDVASHYISDQYLLSQSNTLGVYKGVGVATISASIGSAFTQDVADFATSFVAVHMNYNAVGAQGGYVETGEFHIAYNQSGNSYNHQPKVLLAKNTSQTILNLTSSAAYCNVSAQINPAFGPVEIMYEFTAFTQGII